MATAKQKEAARRNIKKAQNAQKTEKAQSSRPKGAKKAARPSGLSTADKNKLDDSQFAFPKDRKEPLVDAKHVRNAIARFDQVEGVSDSDRDKAWKKIRTAAKKFDVDVSEADWRDLYKGNKKAAKR